MKRGHSLARAYVLMTPALLLVLGVLVYPVAWEVWVSLTNFSSRLGGPPGFVGLQNYRTKPAQDVFCCGDDPISGERGIIEGHLDLST